MRSTFGIVLVGLALTAGGCANSGSPFPSTSPSDSLGGEPATATPTAAASPSPSQAPTETPGATPSQPPSATPSASPGPFAVRSPAFADGAPIPRRFTCDGADVSPGIEWSGAPEGTVSLVLIVRDPDAGDFAHWLAYDIPGAPTGALPAAIPTSAETPSQGRNDFGRRGWGGPCPPSGNHRYQFRLYALDRTLGLGGTPRIRELEAAMKGHVLGQALLTGTYQRS